MNPYEIITTVSIVLLVVAFMPFMWSMVKSIVAFLWPGSEFWELYIEAWQKMFDDIFRKKEEQ